MYAGFIHIKDLEDALIEKMILEREQHGAFLHLADLLKGPISD
jgi:hypothetical protein